MEKVLLHKYSEPIFLVANEESTFLDGSYICTKGIMLDQNSSVPPKNAAIEFSFHGTERILKAACRLVLLDGEMFLKFERISKEDLFFIKNFISSREARSIELCL